MPFKEVSGAVAVVEPQAWPLETKVISAMAAGTVPDVTCIMGKQLVPLLEQGALITMEEAVFEPAGIDPDAFFNPGAIGAFFYNGNHWGIPVEDNNVGQAVGVRTDWVEEAGDEAMEIWNNALELGWFDSFESVWQLAEILQQTDDDGNVKVWGLNGQGWDNRTWMGIMRDLGQDWWDSANQEFFLNSEGAMEALRDLCRRAHLPARDRGALGYVSLQCSLGWASCRGDGEQRDGRRGGQDRPADRSGSKTAYYTGTGSALRR